MHKLFPDPNISIGSILPTTEGFGNCGLRTEGTETGISGGYHPGMPISSTS
jgi:hypothetical protein